MPLEVIMCEGYTISVLSKENAMVNTYGLIVLIEVLLDK